MSEYQTSSKRADIQISYGEFEQDGFADNTNLAFAHELKQRLSLDLKIEPHGHQHLAWTGELSKSLPAALPKHQLDNRLENGK